MQPLQKDIFNKLLIVLWELGRTIPLIPSENPSLLKLKGIIDQLDLLIKSPVASKQRKVLAPRAQLIICATALIKSGEIVETTTEWDQAAKLNRLPLRGQKIDEFLTSESSGIWKVALSAKYTTTVTKIEFQLQPQKFTTALCSVAVFPNTGIVTINVVDIWNNLFPDSRKIKSFVPAVKNYIDLNMDSPLPSTNQLAKMFGTNEFSLKKEFRKHLNTSIYQYLIDKRLDKAYLLIQTTDIPLKEIAFSIGYNDYTNFFKAFRKKFGYPPKQVTRKV